MLLKGPCRVNYYHPGVAFKRCVKKFSTGAYDPDGKTVVNILNNEDDAPLMIDSYSVYGFKLNLGVFVIGPMALFPRSVLSWNVKDDHDINSRSLSLFLHLAPKLDVLVIGLSDPRNVKLQGETHANVIKLLRDINKEHRFQVEVLPTEKAVTTFNFLNSENRFVGAALIPPTYYTPTLDDQYRVEYLHKKKDKGDYFLGS